MRAGNVIQLREMPLNVAEACSGIRMLMLFFAICVGGAFVMKNRKPTEGVEDFFGSIPVIGPLLALNIANWERWVIMISSIPIAIVANVFRLTMTAIFAEIVGKWPNQLLSEEAAKLWPGNFTQTWAHDLPGLMMMPAGLILLWIEWTLLTKLFIEESSDRAAAIRGTARGLLPMSASPQADKNS
jgi:exosortase/archaeosortase family protein